MEIGDPVRIAMEKWGHRPHWTYDAHWLGADAHGAWIGIPAGTPMSRPGAALVARNPQVVLLPPEGAPVEHRGWVATFHGQPREWVEVYVDITTPPTWDDATLRCIDLDLDVIRRVDGSVFVDDEDEFAEHRVSLEYPEEVAAAAELSCARIRADVAAGRPPYDGSHDRWFALLR